MSGYKGEGKKDVFRVGDRAAVEETAAEILEMAVSFSGGWPGVPHPAIWGNKLGNGKDIGSETFCPRPSVGGADSGSRLTQEFAVLSNLVTLSRVWLPSPARTAVGQPHSGTIGGNYRQRLLRPNEAVSRENKDC